MDDHLKITVLGLRFKSLQFMRVKEVCGCCFLFLFLHVCGLFISEIFIFSASSEIVFSLGSVGLLLLTNIFSQKRETFLD